MDKDVLKKWFKASFTLEFTSSKLLAYIIVGLGTWVSFTLKSEGPFTISIIAATALFGVKMFTDGKADKIGDKVIENIENKM